MATPPFPVSALVALQVELGGVVVDLVPTNPEWCRTHEAALVVSQLLTSAGEVHERTICPLASRGCSHQEEVHRLV